MSRWKADCYYQPGGGVPITVWGMSQVHMWRRYNGWRRYTVRSTP